MRRLLLLATLTACKGPYAEVSGTINGAPFTEVGSAFHAGPHIVLFAEKVDCMTADFVERAYSDGSQPTTESFTALQFSVMEADTFNPGTFVFEPNSEVRSYGLTSTADSFVADRGREGFVAITDVDPDGGFIVGEFDVSFTNDAAAGEFRTEYCRNMQP